MLRNCVLPFTVALLFGVLSPSISLAAITLGVVDGRTWHDTNHDGVFSDGAGTSGSVAYIAFTDGTKGSRAGIEFSLSSVPTGVSISSASLSLYFTIARDLNDPNLGPPNVQLLGYVGNGQVNAPDVLASNLLSEFSPSPQSAVTIDVTSFIQGLYISSNGYAGFALRIKDDLLTTTRAEAWFASQVAESSLVPTLTIQTAQPVPEPSTLTIFGLTAFGLAFCRILRRSPK